MLWTELNGPIRGAGSTMKSRDPAHEVLEGIWILLAAGLEAMHMTFP